LPSLFFHSLKLSIHIYDTSEAKDSSLAMSQRYDQS